MKLGLKGQASNTIVQSMILLVIVGFLGIISVTIYENLDSSFTNTASDTAAVRAIGNFSSNFYDSEDLVSNVPIVIASGLLLTVIIGFAVYVRG